MQHQNRTNPKQLIPLGVSIACFSALAAICIFLAVRYQGMAQLDPCPDECANANGQSFPYVDWDYWKQVNPDVVGWITIPETMLDYPIVQARESDPGYYLDHDVFGNWNYMGCPYIDAECADQGLEKSPNAVVSAHNLGFGDESMFAAIAHYSDADFAEQHPIILVQTPSMQMAFEAQGAAVVHGSSDSKRTSFDGEQDLRDWLWARLGECQVRIGSSNPRLERVLTLCTCSYHYWNNERTLLYALPVRQ